MKRAPGPVVFTSDWHLDATTAGLDRFADVAAAVEVVVSAAERAEAGLVAFLGDLSDPDANRAPRCVALAIEVAARLRQKGIPSRWLTGNHDVIEDGSGTSTLTPLGASAAEQLVDRPRAEQLGGVLYIWLPYVPRCAAYDAAAFIAGVDEAMSPGKMPVVVAGHLSIDGMHPGSETTEMGRGREHVLPVEAIRARWPEALIINGHYHAMQVDPARVVIPGSLARLTFGEQDNQPGYLMAQPVAAPRSRKRSGWSVTSYGVPARPLMTVDPITQPEFEQALGPGKLDGVLLRVRPSSAEHPDGVRRFAEQAAAAGAIVKVLPAPSAPAVVVPHAEPERSARQRPRDVVEAMVADAAGVDREALGRLVGEVLDAEGM